jgi:hypothetical protein
MVNYSGSVSLGIYYWSGSAWTVTTDYKYIADAAIDLCYLSVGGVTISGFTTFMTAIIKTLFVQTLTLLSGGTIASSNYVAGTSGFKLTGNTGTIEMINAIISGTLGGSGILGSHMKLENDRISIFTGNNGNTSYTTPAVGDFKLDFLIVSGQCSVNRWSCLSAGAWTLSSNITFLDTYTILESGLGDNFADWTFYNTGKTVVNANVTSGPGTFNVGYLLMAATTTNCIGEVFSGSNIGSSGSPPTQASITLPNRGTWFVQGEKLGTTGLAEGLIYGFYAGNTTFHTASTGEIRIYAIRIA